ncbi:hypothetical protein F5B22DRAFT_560661 [Xylaria bambusicola]|uniref:uncharacterized protein n=1 Tax=Xylaria bambusicola TaxID=326684 RepID=UPI002008D882|nr:uncharacterized protein F5B22DRAFT_560661 [Xylaria bambusicola]KAI0503221.1 hypothetical protein F5B22DRAFT_560661 [Xylaria bambusicola]
MDAAGLAISLSGAVLKLVIFSLDFISDVKQVYTRGATDLNLDLSTVAESVALATTSLENQLAATDGNSIGESQELDPDEARLKSLSMRATEISRELVYKLNKVTTDKRSTWKSLKTAALGLWDADEIEKTEKRLNAIKDEIQFTILVSIRNKINQSPDDDNFRILTTLEEVVEKQAQSKEDSAHLIELLNDADRVGRGRHEELVNLGNHLLRAIGALSNANSPYPTPLPLVPVSLHDDKARQAAEAIILNSLWYPSICDREETIHEAHANTFKWIFEDPETTGKEWGNFVNFLQGDSSSYWITGKPGSGKSTLMKYINQTPKTQVLLQQWSGENPLIYLSHYFYYGGGNYQKSEMGLFKSLLHSILDKRRELLPIAFKDRFQAALEGKKHHDPTLPEARRALVDLIRHSPNINFFFSIDGLDEFDPQVSTTHVQSLIDFTHFLEKCDNVKILVSSRPLPEFERGYSGRPFLKVQDLTREDIRRYAHEKLMDHPRMKMLERKDPESTGSLLNSIVDSSLGVFLWVRVVTESLIEGLTNYDDIDDLKQTLQGLPSDIHALYRTILERMRPIHKPKAARLLGIVHNALQHGQTLCLLDLWFADSADNDMVFNTAVVPIPDEDFCDRVDELETRLKSQCLGLIETELCSPNQKTHPGRESPRIRHPPNGDKTVLARFLHRSVFEFLSNEDIWSEVVEKYLERKFSAALCLFRSSILLIKTYRLYSDVKWMEIISIAQCAGDRAKYAENETKQSHCKLVHELDRAMHDLMPSVYQAANNQNDMTKGLTLLLGREYHWSVWCRHELLFADHSHYRDLRPLHDRTHGSLMAFAVENALVGYIRSQISEKGRQVLDKKGLPLLGYAMMPISGSRYWISPETIQLLLEEGSNPNQTYNGTSLWEWYLWTMYVFRQGFEGFKYEIETWATHQRIKAMEELLLSGVNPNARMIYLSRYEGSDWKTDWNLPWTPATFTRGSSSICTLLSAFLREHQAWKDKIIDAWTDHPEWIGIIGETLKRIIILLRERGAVEEEWENVSEMKQVFVDVYQKMTDKEPLLLDEDDAIPKPEEENLTENKTSDVLLEMTTSEASVTPESQVESNLLNVTDAGRGDSEQTTLAANEETRQVEPVSPIPADIVIRSKKGWRKSFDRMIQKVKHRLW